jgi:uncharacterized protein DUF4291
MRQYRKRIRGCFDEQGVYVYQAFSPDIVRVAVSLGTFGKGFGLDRMTWIKPSFGWMLHRSSYATKTRQEAIARIYLKHEGFLNILQQAVPTLYDASLYGSQGEWGLALKKSEVRYQWDPDRDLHDYKLDRRAIQLGISGQIVYRYVREWIIGIEDVTGLAHMIKEAVENDKAMPAVPEEREYPVPADIAHRLGYDDGAQEDT